MFFKNCGENKKINFRIREKYLQIVYLIMDLYPDYLRNSPNAIIRKETIQFKYFWHYQVLVRMWNNWNSHTLYYGNFLLHHMPQQYYSWEFTFDKNLCSHKNLYMSMYISSIHFLNVINSKSRQPKDCLWRNNNFLSDPDNILAT